MVPLPTPDLLVSERQASAQAAAEESPNDSPSPTRRRAGRSGSRRKRNGPCHPKPLVHVAIGVFQFPVGWDCAARGGYEMYSTMAKPASQIGSILAALVALLLDSGAWASEPLFRIKTLSPPPASQFKLTTLGSELYFVKNQYEIWKSDGTPSGTALFRGGLTYPVQDLAAAGGLLFFYTCDPTNGCGTWRSDGTEAGTIVLSSGSISVASIRFANGAWYFPAGSAASGFEPWRSDGTPGGTSQITDIVPGPGDSLPTNPSPLVGVGSSIFITTKTSLWVSDGTAAGTAEVAPASLVSAPSEVVDLGGIAIFRGTDGAGAGREPWRSDGTLAGTFQLADIEPGIGGSRPAEFVRLGGLVIFRACNTAAGCELWSTDGTTASLLSDIRPGSASSTPSTLTLASGRVFFSADDGNTGRELWATDGTPAGTMMVRDILSGSGGSEPTEIVTVGSQVFFAASDAFSGRELWKSDGTPAGTARVGDLFAGSGSSVPRALKASPLAGFFVGAAGDGQQTLYRSQGTSTSTVALATLTAQFGSGGVPPIPLGDRAVFSATREQGDDEFWFTNGTGAGTFAIDANPGPGGINDGTFLMTSAPPYLFQGNDEQHGAELWSTDGFPGGTSLVKDIAPGSLSSGFGLFSESLGGYRYFSANDLLNGAELWRTDGTGAGTQLAIDLNPGPGSSFPNQIMEWNGKLIFSASTPATGSEIWVSDGSSGGTSVIDIVPGGDGSDPSGSYLTENAFTRAGYVPTPVGLVFTADVPGVGREPWITDGTVAGTQQLADINPGAAGSIGGSLFFSPISGVVSVSPTVVLIAADDGVHGCEPWITDGTPAGTALFADLNPGPSGSLREYGTCGFGGTATRAGVLFFSANDGVTGREPWRTDGTLAGTYQLGDLEPGTGDSMAVGEYTGQFNGSFTGLAIGSQVYFNATTTSHGQQIWRTDGTVSGTVRVSDQPWLGVAAFSHIGGTVFVAADGVGHNSELWVLLTHCGDGSLDPGEICDDGNQLSGDGCAPDCTPENESVTGTAPAGGAVTTDPEQNGATTGDPVETTVFTPTGGTISIAETSAPGNLGAGFNVMGIAMNIVAPAASPTDPLQLVFQFDGSVIPPGYDELSIRIFRNGVLVPACTGPAGQAVPDPCVASRVRLTDGDALFSVLTSAASQWSFAIDLCSDAPLAACKMPLEPGKSSFSVVDKSNDSGDSAKLKWVKGAATSFAELGDPTAATAYGLCVYDNTAGVPRLRLRAIAPAGILCGTKPCWKVRPGKGFGYRNPAATPDGMKVLTVSAGADGKAKVGLTAGGGPLETPVLPLSLAGGGVIAQIVNGDGGCWEATFSAPTKNDEVQFKAKSD